MKINEFINNDDIKPGDVLMIETDGTALVGIVLGVKDGAVLIEGDTYPLDEQDTITDNKVNEVKQRLDPKCWTGYRKQGTKVKDGVRVNNCVKVNENDMDEEEEESYYDAINHMENLYHTLVEKKFVQAASYLSELGMLYQEVGVYLPTAIDMVTDRKTQMHIEKLNSLLDSNKDDVIRGILTMIKTGDESAASIGNLISVLDNFGVEWPELDTIEAAVVKSLPNRIDEAGNWLKAGALSAALTGASMGAAHAQDYQQVSNNAQQSQIYMTEPTWLKPEMLAALQTARESWLTTNPSATDIEGLNQYINDFNKIAWDTSPAARRQASFGVLQYIKDHPGNGNTSTNESEYQGRKVQLGKPTRGDVRKYKVFVKNPKTGNIKKVNFGDPNMEIKRDDPARRKSFRARHGCGTPRASDRTKAAYWSCRMWSSKPVSKILKGK